MFIWKQIFARSQVGEPKPRSTAKKSKKKSKGE